jgi:hypothetical protein
MENMKKICKAGYFSKFEDFFLLLPSLAKGKIHVFKMAYRPTVYKTGMEALA